MRLATLLSLAAVLATPAAAATLNVSLDQSTRITLSRPARDVVVGNPAVADVNMIDSQTLVVLGKGFGATNLLVMDKAGKTIANHQVVVTSPDVGAVSVYRGAQVQTFACAARCEESANKAYSSTSASPSASPAPAVPAPPLK